MVVLLQGQSKEQGTGGKSRALISHQSDHAQRFNLQFPHSIGGANVATIIGIIGRRTAFAKPRRVSSRVACAGRKRVVDGGVIWRREGAWLPPWLPVGRGLAAPPCRPVWWGDRLR